MPPGPQVTDAAVIKRSFVEPESFSGIFDRHWDRIAAYCRSRAGDVGEDIAAEVFGIAFDDRHGFRASHESAAPWLFGIAANLIRRHYRGLERAGRATRRLVPDLVSDDTDATITRIEAELLGGELAVALEGLRPDDRETLLLHAWAELSHEEIAIATDTPLGTVKSRLNRSRNLVRGHLDAKRKESR